MRSQLIRRLAERIAPDDIDGAVIGLSRAPELDGNLEWLQLVFDAADTLALPRVPDHVSDSLRSIFVASADHDDTSPSGETRVELALPIHDSRTSGQLVGVRGDHSDDGWTALFTAPSADIILDGLVNESGGTDVSGQVLIRTGDPHQFAIRASGPQDAELDSDDAGQFDFGQLSAGTYQMTARSPSIELRWTTSIGQEPAPT